MRNTAAARKSHEARHRDAMSVVAIALAMVVAVVALALVHSPRTSSAGPSTDGLVPATGAPTVTIKDFAFSPAALSVKAGTTVVWTNQDSEPHTVRSVGSDTLKSTTLDDNATYSYTFTTAGTYAYHCSIHAEMHGTVIVTK